MGDGKSRAYVDGTPHMLGPLFDPEEDVDMEDIGRVVEYNPPKRLSSDETPLPVVMESLLDDPETIESQED